MDGQDTQTSTQYDYIGNNVQIGGGFFGMMPLAQKGSVVIGDGVLSLLGSQGQLLEKAPLASVDVKRSIITMGAAAWVRMNGKRYSVSIAHGDYAVGPLVVVPGLTLGASSSATGDFIKIFNQLSGKN